MRQDKYEQKKKRMGIVITILMAFIMIASIFAIVVDNQSQTVPSYNKHKFIATDKGYQTKINGVYQGFYYHPTELEDIALSKDIVAKMQNSKGIGVIFDPEDNITDDLLYVDVIRFDMESEIDKPIYFGTTKNSTKYSLPIAGCDAATEEYPVILINASTNTSFVESTGNPNCIIMNARLKGLLEAKDRFVYAYYGIMQ